MSEETDEYNVERKEEKKTAEELKRSKDFKRYVVIYLMGVMTSLVMIGLGLKSLEDTVHEMGLCTAGLVILVSHVIILFFLTEKLSDGPKDNYGDRY